MALPTNITDKIRGIHQYYRDCLTRHFDFPGIGAVPLDIVKWAIDPRNLSPLQLVEHLRKVPAAAPATDQELALRLMLFLILQANTASDVHNRFEGYEIPEQMKSDVRAGIARILTLHGQVEYLANAVRIMYRLNMIDDVLAFVRKYPAEIAKYRDLQAIAGFLYTMLGDYGTALIHLMPLVQDEKGRGLPLVALSWMTCNYHFLPKPSDWPVTFETLHSKDNEFLELIGHLPPLEVISALPRDETKTIIFVACNDRYFFEHLLFLLYSIADREMAGIAVHCHLYSPNVSMHHELALFAKNNPQLPIGVSAEYSVDPENNTATYFSSARFLRAHEIFSLYDSPLCVMDADSLFNRDWRDFLAMIDQAAEVVLVCPSASPFWERVAAGFTFFRPTAKSRFLLGKVAEFVLKNLQMRKQIWFIDQIALSVCDHKFARAWSEVAHLDMARVMDTKHGPEAITWAVTTKKVGNQRYDSLRERLGAKFGQLPHVSVDYIFRYISTQRPPIFFLQVGAMDGVSYDPIHPYVKQFGWQGILVEPLPDMMDLVRNNYSQCSGLSFENVAITEREEVKTLYRIPADTAVKAGLPHWVLGMSTFDPNKLKPYGSNVVQQSVACVPLSTVIAKHQPRSIDVLQIDTEGYDFKVLSQFDFSAYRPLVVNFEAVNLKPEDLLAATDLLFRNGYLFYRNDMDIFAVQRELVFPRHP